MGGFWPKSRYNGRVMAREIFFYQCLWVTKFCAKFGCSRTPRTAINHKYFTVLWCMWKEQAPFVTLELGADYEGHNWKRILARLCFMLHTQNSRKILAQDEIVECFWKSWIFLIILRKKLENYKLSFPQKGVEYDAGRGKLSINYQFWRFLSSRSVNWPQWIKTR